MGKSTSPTLLIVTGAPATGKTFLAMKISAKLNLPLIRKDLYKEIMLDSLGWSNREFVAEQGRAAYEIAFALTTELLSHNQNMILEANFRPTLAQPMLDNIIAETHPRVYQLYLHANSQVLFERFKQRAVSNIRHPGYLDRYNVEEFAKSIEAREYEKLALPGKTWELDTSDFGSGIITNVVSQLVSELKTSISPTC